MFSSADINKNRKVFRNQRLIETRCTRATPGIVRIERQRAGFRVDIWVALVNGAWEVVSRLIQKLSLIVCICHDLVEVVVQREVARHQRLGQRRIA